MKKFFITFLIIFTANFAFGFEMPTGREILEYSKQPYIGMPFNEALKKDLPYILIFANPANVFMLSRLAPIAQMAYDEFKGQYNFCIVNTSVSENEILINYFKPEKLPALYLIDTKEKTFTLIERKYYNKKAIRKILTKFKDGTLFN